MTFTWLRHFQTSDRVSYVKDEGVTPGVITWLWILRQKYTRKLTENLERLQTKTYSKTGESEYYPVLELINFCTFCSIFWCLYTPKSREIGINKWLLRSEILLAISCVGFFVFKGRLQCSRLLPFYYAGMINLSLEVIIN